MSNLKALIDGYVDRHGSSYRAISERLGWSHGTISGWFTRSRTSPQTADELRSLAGQIQVSYKQVLEATLLDYGYLPEEGQAHGQPPAEKIDDDNGGAVTQLRPNAPTSNAPAKRAARKTTDPRKK